MKRFSNSSAFFGRIRTPSPSGKCVNTRAASSCRASVTCYRAISSVGREWSCSETWSPRSCRGRRTASRRGRTRSSAGPGTGRRRPCGCPSRCSRGCPGTTYTGTLTPAKISLTAAVWPAVPPSDRSPAISNRSGFSVWPAICLATFSNHGTQCLSSECRSLTARNENASVVRVPGGKGPGPESGGQQGGGRAAEEFTTGQHEGFTTGNSPQRTQRTRRRP